MELRLTHQAAKQTFEAWMRFLEAHPGTRNLEDGTIKLDSVPGSLAEGVPHQMDGSLVIAWYISAESSNAARRTRPREPLPSAVAGLGLPRQLLVGRLVDLKRNRTDNSVYMKVRSALRRGSDEQGGYRSLNPSKGRLIEMIINPTAADMEALPPLAPPPTED